MTLLIIKIISRNFHLQTFPVSVRILVKKGLGGEGEGSGRYSPA